MNANTLSLKDMHPKRWDIWLLLSISLAILITGLFLPILTMRQLGFIQNTFSILTGIEALLEESHYLLAFIVFTFSIVFPIGKLMVLFWIWLKRMTTSQRQMVLHALKVLGKWSMLDVFVVALIVVAAKLSAFASAQARIGIYVFGLAIFLSMISTMLLDQLTHSDKEELRS